MEATTAGAPGSAATHGVSAIALGGIERVKDDVRDARGTRLLQDVARDFGFALRTLARNPGFALSC